MHVEICDVSCVLVKTVKTQKQIKYKKKINNYNSLDLGMRLSNETLWTYHSSLYINEYGGVIIQPSSLSQARNIVVQTLWTSIHCSTWQLLMI